LICSSFHVDESQGQVRMQYYTARQAAQHLGKSEKTIRRWIQTGHLKAQKKGRRFVISQSDLDKFTGQFTGKPDMRNVRTRRKTGQNDIGISQNELEGISGHSTGQPDIVSYADLSLVEDLKAERKRLQEENVQLWKLLGKAEEATKQLENQIKALEAHLETERKRTWWTRLWKKA